MSAFGGIVLGAAQLGLQAILVKPRRSIGPFVATVTLEETHQDDLEITDHPVEVGASITDHAFKLPASLVIKAAWTEVQPATNIVQSLKNAVSGTINGVAGIAAQAGFDTSRLSNNGTKSLRDIYTDMLALQARRELLDVYTGKRVYKNMLVKSIVEKTDKDTENLLLLTITLREILVVSTQTISLAEAVVSPNSKDLKAPEKNALTTNSGQKQLIPAAR